jgi:Ca2+-transporting ATPase
MRMRISDLTVGDVVCLEPGDAAPADGIVITSQEIKCDESLATGESDHVEKCSGFKAWDSRAASGSEHDIDPFIISGSNVLEGIGTYLVTSVGPHSTYGRIMVALGTETDPTPLQVKLARLASWIGWFGLGYRLPLLAHMNEVVVLTSLMIKVRIVVILCLVCPFSGTAVDERRDAGC